MLFGGKTRKLRGKIERESIHGCHIEKSKWVTAHTILPTQVTAVIILKENLCAVCGTLMKPEAEACEL